MKKKLISAILACLMLLSLVACGGDNGDSGNSGDPNSGSSQFFIVHEDSTFLDGSYAAFGHVTEGIEVVDAVCESSRPIDDNGTILPEEQPMINSITVID